MVSRVGDRGHGNVGKGAGGMGDRPRGCRREHIEGGVKGSSKPLYGSGSANEEERWRKIERGGERERGSVIGFCCACLLPAPIWRIISQV